MIKPPHSATACCKVKRCLPTTAAIQAKSVKIVRMQLEAFAGLEKGAGHPARRKAQQAAALLERGFNERRNLVFDNFKRRNGIHGF